MSNLCVNAIFDTKHQKSFSNAMSFIMLNLAYIYAILGTKFATKFGTKDSITLTL